MVLVVPSAGRHRRADRDVGRHRGRRRPGPPRARCWPSSPTGSSPTSVEATRAGAGRAWSGTCPRMPSPGDPVLDAPTVRDLMGAVGGTLVTATTALLDRESLGLVVAAMTMPNVLDRLFEGGGRHRARRPRATSCSGLLLAHRVQDLPERCRASSSTAASSCPADRPAHRGPRRPRADHRHARRARWRRPQPCSARGPRLTRSSTRKVETALRLFDEHVDGPALLGPARRRPSRASSPR